MPNEERVNRGSRLVANAPSAYRHTFGGPRHHRFIGPDAEGLKVHLLYNLDLDDPLVDLHIPGIRHLPLYYPFRHEGCGLAYRVRSESLVEILAPPRDPMHEFWPYRNYPEHFPEVPIGLAPLTYEQQKTLVFASVLPEAVSEADRAYTTGYVQPFPQVRGWFRLLQGHPGRADPRPTPLDTGAPGVRPDPLSGLPTLWLHHSYARDGLIVI